jgi:hypothetical protein
MTLNQSSFPLNNPCFLSKQPRPPLKATLVRSDATKIPYDKEIGSITIESRNRPKQYIRLRRFRTVEIKWINDRLLYIYCDIGHIASVDAIFDAQTGKWIYHQSMSYEND